MAPSSQRHTPSRVCLAASAVLIVSFLTIGPALQGQTRADEHWVGAWATAATWRVEPGQPQPGQSGAAAAPAPPPAGAAPPQQPHLSDAPPHPLHQGPLPVGGQSPLQFHDQTLRQITHISIGGDQLRVVLTNVFGTVPLKIGAASVALRDKGAAIVANSSRPLMFSGRPTVTIPPGAEMVSDPVPLTVAPFADLVIDIYLPENTAEMKSPITTHASSWQTNFVSRPGNHVGSVSLPVLTTTQYRRADGVPTSTWFFLERVEVTAPAQTRAVVTLGDSITDGTHSGIDTNNRWPDHLAKRLAQANMKMSVLNIGIGGNRLLGDGNGVNALARFDHDVLGQPGVTHLIVLEGINDIGFAGSGPNPSAADLIAAHRQIIERAHAHGIKAIGATLTPFEGAFYYTPQGEAKRKALNDWIRTSKMYDAVVDFDAVIRDPNHPTKTLAKYDPGDHLHPNPTGYAAMAEAIDLSWLKPAAARQQIASR